MALADDLPQLECGRTTEQVWAGIDRPPDDHERSCAYCRQARADLHLLQEAVASEHRLTAEGAEQPSGRVKNAIMDIARHEIRQGRRIPLEQSTEPSSPADLPPEPTDRRRAEPDLAITERALTEVVLVAADGVAAVRARRVRVTPVEDAGLPVAVVTGAAETLPAVVALTVTVSVRADARIPETVAVLRERIADTVAVRVGLTVDRIDITVEDVHDD